MYNFYHDYFLITLILPSFCFVKFTEILVRFLNLPYCTGWINLSFKWSLDISLYLIRWVGKFVSSFRTNQIRKKATGKMHSNLGKTSSSCKVFKINLTEKSFEFVSHFHSLGFRTNQYFHFHQTCSIENFDLKL